MNKPAHERHTPVLLAEVIAAVAPKDGEVHVDGTFGAGGYAKAMLAAADCTVWGIDRDPKAVAQGKKVARRYGGRLSVVAGRYGDMEELLAPMGVDALDGVAFDLGASMMQLGEPERGFSFRHDGPLDMRMEATGASAADAVNSLGESELSDIIYNYGEERASRRIAKAIVRARDEEPILTTGVLADIVRRAIRARGARGGKRPGAIDPATRTFQALRIYVNDELNELDRGLLAAEAMLKPGGRIAVVAFHSLEDRRVKSFFSIRCGASARPSRHTPSLSSRGTSRAAAPSFHLLNRRVIKPGAEEIARNPRARSARLRAAVRTEAPPWSATAAE
jgi:16S rRNA (cytosine1402-N4)-methyltransferase